MSSRYGQRATGSDGRDYMHRENVAGHFKASVTNKSRLKFDIFLHFLLFVLMVTRLSTALCVMFGFRPPTVLQRIRLPKAQAWEFGWMASIISSFMALFSLRKNRTFLMRQYIIGTVLFGLVPVIYAIYSLSDDLVDYWQTRKPGLMLFGFPVVVLWNMFLAIALQVHGFGLYFAWQLIKAWRPKSNVKKRN